MPTSTTSKTMKKGPSEAHMVAKDMAAMSDENLDAWWADAETDWADKAFRRSAAGKAARKRLSAQANKEVRKVSGELVKSMDEWDLEELARGRPRNSAGTFAGPVPKYVARAVHEQAMERFTNIVTGDMRAIIPTALDTIRWVLECRDEDDKGRPIVTAGTKLTAAQWVIEHLVGKPTQRVEADISVRLQGLLASVMVSPESIQEGAPLALAMAQPDWIDAEVDDDEVRDEG